MAPLRRRRESKLGALERGSIIILTITTLTAARNDSACGDHHGAGQISVCPAGNCECDVAEAGKRKPCKRFRMTPPDGSDAYGPL
jgi:hypothetical protein